MLQNIRFEANIRKTLSEFHSLANITIQRNFRLQICILANATYLRFAPIRGIYLLKTTRQRLQLFTTFGTVCFAQDFFFKFSLGIKQFYFVTLS